TSARPGDPAAGAGRRARGRRAHPRLGPRGDRRRRGGAPGPPAPPGLPGRRQPRPDRWRTVSPSSSPSTPPVATATCRDRLARALLAPDVPDAEGGFGAERHRRGLLLAAIPALAWLLTSAAAIALGTIETAATGPRALLRGWALLPDRLEG